MGGLSGYPALGLACAMVAVDTSAAPTDAPDIPDRVSIEPDSPFFLPDYAKLSVRIAGRDSTSCVEFCVSEGWARCAIYAPGGRFKRERGKIVTSRVVGKVEPRWRAGASDPRIVPSVIAKPAVPAVDAPPLSRQQRRYLERKGAR